MPLDLTIAIPVKNEAKNLPLCLQAIGKDFAEKIVVIDSDSSDNTTEIALAFGAEVIDFKWDGNFPKKRNWYLRNHTPSTKWILFLDADEYLTDAFKNELTRALSKNDEFDGYWLRYSIYFMDKKMIGGYPLNKLALFKVGSAEYERIDEDRWSKLDMEIHEHPIVAGKVGKILSPIDHRDYRGIQHYWNKHAEYANWEAVRYLKAKNDATVRDAWTLKQKLKYYFIETPLIGPFFFIGSFIFMGGFLNGYRGLAFAITKMGYFTQIYCRIKELKNEN